MRKLDLTGQRFGRLIVVSEAEPRRFPCGAVRRSWLCRCDCGKAVETNQACLKNGDTRSCGCLKRDMIRSPEARERAAANARTHGLHGTRTYRSWTAMIDRCTNPNHTFFKNYGGRGIIICPRWRESFEAFLADMGERPAGMTLDRYPDPDGDYEPGNCRWATAKEQRANQRDSREGARP